MMYWIPIQLRGSRISPTVAFLEEKGINPFTSERVNVGYEKETSVRAVLVCV